MRAVTLRNHHRLLHEVLDRAIRACGRKGYELVELILRNIRCRWIYVVRRGVGNGAGVMSKLLRRLS